MTLKVAAFVPAKGSSERVPSKNMRILDGEYLFRRKLTQLLSCSEIDEVWLDTDSEEIIQNAADLPIKILRRRQELASNSTDGHELFENECLHAVDADIVVQALCTAPFVDGATIGTAVAKLKANHQNDSLIAVTRSKQYTWSDGEPSYGRGRIPNSVDLPATLIEAMSLYMMRRSSQDFPRKRFGQSTILFELNAVEQLDINYPEDLVLAETICLGRRMSEFNYFRILKHHLSSSILSDVTKEMGYSFMADRALQPISPGKVLGRAKTLKIGALQGGDRDIASSDAWKGIYRALNSYSFVRTGDVIVVENGVPDRAYFGDLNCHLAMRAGATGVLVDGVTRDVGAVRAMGLPVYARGAWSNDIKFEGTTLSYNLPVNFGGICVNNEDVVFADEEGVLVFPKQLWPLILEKSLEGAENESKIRQSLLAGTNVDEVISKFGFF